MKCLIVVSLFAVVLCAKRTKEAAAEGKIQLHVEREEKEFGMRRVKRGPSLAQEGDNSAEYNFYDLALSLISRQLGASYADLDLKLIRVAADRASELYGPSTSSGTSSNNKYDWVDTFPGAVRDIQWSQVHPKWTGPRGGFDAMLNSLPGLIGSALCVNKSVDEGELRELVNQGEIAVKHRQELGQENGADEGHQQSTNLLRATVKTVKRIVEDLFSGVRCPDPQHYELRRRDERYEHIHRGFKSFTVKFYEDIDFGGHHQVYDISEVQNGVCFDIVRSKDAWYDVSSVNTGDGCVVIYSKASCEGRSIVLLPGSVYHNDLTKRSFNDVAQSFRSC